MKTSQKSSDLVRFFVGTYSQPGPYFDAKGKGLISCTLNVATGALQECVIHAGVINATYLAKIPGSELLFVASDMYFSPGDLHLYRILPDGQIEWLSSRSAHGQAVCHVELSRDQAVAYVCSYIDGKMSRHSIEDLKIAKASTVYQYDGRSVNVARQEAAHAHQATLSPDEKHLYVCDLGSDRIWIHDPRQIEQVLGEVMVPAGYGPRHLCCHPELPRVYLVCELNARLLTYARTEHGHLELLDETETLPKDFDGVPSAAAICLHPSMKTLYVSNRNSDSIEVFSLDSLGMPVFATRFSSGGAEPRDFAFEPEGRWLIVANQNSHRIVSFPLDAESGLPTGEQTASLDCGAPVSVLFD